MASIDSAKAARRSASTAEKSNRPHLFVEHDGRQFVLRNVGRTPAINIRSDLHTTLPETGDLIGHDGTGRYVEDAPFDTSTTEHSYAVMAPDQVPLSLLHVDEPPLPNELEGTRVYIAVRYSDTFGGDYWMACSFGTLNNGELGFVIEATESTQVNE